MQEFQNFFHTIVLWFSTLNKFTKRQVTNFKIEEVTTNP